VYELDTLTTFFERGSGKLTARQNTITVGDASVGGVVLKYHWLDHWRTEPELPVRKFAIPGDPVGFIEIDNGTCTDFVLYNSYRRRE